MRVQRESPDAPKAFWEGLRALTAAAKVGKVYVQDRIMDKSQMVVVVTGASQSIGTRVNRSLARSSGMERL
jgi:hypothetical protein